MKQFIGILFVICGLGAAAYYCYDPYIKPFLDKSGIDIAGSPDRVITEDDKPAPKATAPKTATPAAPKAAPKAPKAAAPVKKEAPKSEIDKLVEQKYPMPTILPLTQIVNDWKAVPAKAYPKEITSKENLAFDLVVNGQKIGSSNTAPGTPVKPVRLVGDQLTIASLANPAMSLQVHVDKTDFKQRIQQRYDSFVEYKKNQISELRAKAKKALEANPERLASVKGGGGPADSSDDPRFSAVKRSIASGEVSTVTPEEAKTFKWNGSERIGGELAGSYDTVTVHFEISTIFGMFPTDMKCLLKGGRVVGWVDPITEEKI